MPKKLISFDLKLHQRVAIYHAGEKVGEGVVTRLLKNAFYLTDYTGFESFGKRVVHMDVSAVLIFNNQPYTAEIL